MRTDSASGALKTRTISHAVASQVAFIGGMIDAGLMQQVRFDFESLKRATGRAFTPEETERFFAVQQQATRWTFLGTGMSHPNFLAITDLLKPGSSAKLEQIVPLFS